MKRQKPTEEAQKKHLELMNDELYRDGYGKNSKKRQCPYPLDKSLSHQIFFAAMDKPDTEETWEEMRRLNREVGKTEYGRWMKGYIFRLTGIME